MATNMTLEPMATPSSSGGKSSDKLLLTVDWLSTTGGASTTSTADFNYMFRPISDYIQGRELNIAQTVPGSVTPTDQYDVTVSDNNGQDLFGGALANRSATVTESSYTYDGTVFGSRPIGGTLNGDLSIAVTNAGNAKTGKLILTFE